MRMARSLVLWLTGLVLSGCITSSTPLFDPAAAVTPLKAGRYVQQADRDGAWVDDKAGRLSLNGRDYTWKVEGDSEESQRFRLFGAGAGFYVASTPKNDLQPQKGSYYALVEVARDAVYIYAPICPDFRKVRLPPADRPTLDGGDCVYGDATTLTRALRGYADRLYPSQRYVLRGD